MSVETRTIAVVTGSRAEYGLLSGLIARLQIQRDLKLQLVVTGAHLSKRFGYTAAEIHQSGIPVSAEIDLALSGDQPLDAARACGRGIERLTEAFVRLRPDLIVVLGDRFEILAAGLAALFLDIPVAHIHGGEITEGAIDDTIRHALTKIAALHFVAAAPYRRRVIQMGEPPDRVFDVGALAIDNTRSLPLPGRRELEAQFGVPADMPYFLVTYHPVTRRQGNDRPVVEAMLAALHRISGARIVLTGVNADPGHESVYAPIAWYVSAHPGRAILCPSLGRVGYLGAMRHALAVVGNSSSGLIEAPAVGVPTVNIGSRQKGRLRAVSVIDCGESEEEIFAALIRASEPAFRCSMLSQVLPYDGHGVADRIVDILRTVDLRGLREKRFHDLAEGAF